MRMSLLCAMLLLPLLVVMETLQSTTVQERLRRQLDDSRDTVDWIGEGILNAVDAFFPVTQTTVEARNKKKHKLNKYLIPLIVGFMLIKSILLPIALKTLAILSGKAVVLSVMSLILAAIVGLKKVAQSQSSNYNAGVHSSKYRRQDMFDFVNEVVDGEPYKFYRERRRKK